MKKGLLFADVTKELIGVARDIALNLGSENITAHHFVLADCLLDEDYSLRKLFFNTEEEFQKFYDAQRVAEKRILTDNPGKTLSLANDAEAAIRNSLKEMKRSGHKKVYPFHLLLAVSHFEENYFGTLVKSDVSVYYTLLEYYRKGGFIPEKVKRPGLLYRLFWMREGEY